MYGVLNPFTNLFTSAIHTNLAKSCISIYSYRQHGDSVHNRWRRYRIHVARNIAGRSAHVWRFWVCMHLCTVYHANFLHSPCFLPLPLSSSLPHPPFLTFTRSSFPSPLSCFSIHEKRPGSDPMSSFNAQKKFNPAGKSPNICTEYYTGWLTHWGESMANTSSTEVRAVWI